MNNRGFTRLVLIILAISFVLTGCSNSYQAEFEELQQKYSLLEENYAKLQKEYKKIQNLPDITASLLDDQNEVIDLVLYSFLKESQEAYSEYFCTIGKMIYNYNVTITCNNGEKVDDIYWIGDDGTIQSIMNTVSCVDNTYIFQVTTHIYHIHSLIIQCNDKTVYTSFYGTHRID